MKKCSLSLALGAAFVFGCGSSDSSTPNTTSDAGTVPVADAGGASCTTKTYANFGQSFFEAKCNGCHAVTTPRFTSLTAIRTNLARCKAEISSGSMPQGSPLSSQEKAGVLEWLNCGAP